MNNERLAWTLGWASLGIGLTELTFPERICRVLGLPKRSGLVRACGLREVASGLGLLLQPHRRQWAWTRVAGDALDFTLLAMSFWRPRANKTWLGAIIAGAAGLTLVDIYAIAKQSPPLLRSPNAEPSLGMELGDSSPVESWRGSGLAEDVGTGRRQDDESEPDEVRQRRMDEAARKLGLPDPDQHVTR